MAIKNQQMKIETWKSKQNVELAELHISFSHCKKLSLKAFKIWAKNWFETKKTRFSFIKWDSCYNKTQNVVRSLWIELKSSKW